MHQHIFKPSDKEGFEICECGTYHNIDFVYPKELYEGEYWDGEAHSLFEHQRNNMLETESCGISKVDKIMQFVPKGEWALEIACSPGEILNRLSETGYSNVFGIEPSLRYIDPIANVARQARIINGFFPDCTYPLVGDVADCIIGADILEHVVDYNAFLWEVHRLLKVGGTAILMSPIILHDGQYRERDFHKIEHCWIFSQRFLEPYLKTIFSSVSFERWICGHEIIILTK